MTRARVFLDALIDHHEAVAQFFVDWQPFSFGAGEVIGDGVLFDLFTNLIDGLAFLGNRVDRLARIRGFEAIKQYCVVAVIFGFSELHRQIAEGDGLLLVGGEGISHKDYPRLRPINVGFAEVLGHVLVVFKDEIGFMVEH